MLSSLLIGLSVLASITGVSSGTKYEMAEEDFIQIASVIGGQVLENENGFCLTNAIKTDDIYSITGQNRYFEVELQNGGYLIYDKQEDCVLEYDFWKTSPYKDYDEKLKVLYQDNLKMNYIVYNQDTFIELNTKKSMSNSTLEYMANAEDKVAGEYYTNIRPGADASLIPNSFYFQNLNSYHGLNDSNICTIIATQIALGYYDTFQNDTIVDEEFDLLGVSYNNSRFVKDFTQSPGTGTTWGNQGFRDYLVNLTTEVIGHSPANEGMYTTEQIKLIRRYLNDKNIEYTLNTSEGNWGDHITNRAKKVIKNTIDAGRPVLTNGTGHSTIAYGYDDNYVYVHTGWGHVAATPWSTFTSGFFGNGFDLGAIDIIITAPHWHSDNYYSSTYDEYYCPDGCKFTKDSMDPENYGYAGAYYPNEVTDTIIVGDLRFNTIRKRCGYIENEYINISSRRENVNEAYIEYHFDCYVKKIQVDISFWSASERYYTGSSATIDYLDANGQWQTVVDLLKIGLSTNRANQDRLIISFPDGTTAFRIHATNEAEGDRNKGRISIGHLEILHS
ncbi:MAG: C10 family peptidase [Anaeroplasmataceae bacterium]|nr:C10 family peptidase [Anaeroplasmataceae bacterium]